MIDLHTHSLFSDGTLLPSELLRRAESKGYKAIAITDHADSADLKTLLDRIPLACRDFNLHGSIRAIYGVELTHVPPDVIPDLTQQARQLGAQLVVAHGETLIEPVKRGTNLAAIEAGVDILAHPGLVTAEEAKRAARRGVHFEITTRKGHCLSNGHVVTMARNHGVKLVLNNDTHEPDDLVSEALAKKIALGAGLTQVEIRMMWQNAETLVRKILKMRGETK